MPTPTPAMVRRALEPATQAEHDKVTREVWGEFAEPEILSGRAGWLWFAGRHAEADALSAEADRLRRANSTPAQLEMIRITAINHPDAEQQVSWFCDGHIEILGFDPKTSRCVYGPVRVYR